MGPPGGSATGAVGAVGPATTGPTSTLEAAAIGAAAIAAPAARAVRAVDTVSLVMFMFRDKRAGYSLWASGADHRTEPLLGDARVRAVLLGCAEPIVHALLQRGIVSSDEVGLLLGGE